MSEIVFASSDARESRRISQRVTAGELRSLRPRVYTSNLKDEPAQIVRRNLALILGQLYLNAELTHAGLSRIIVPTVLRDDYILALKGLTNNALTEPFFRVLAKAQEFTASVDYAEFDGCVRELERRNAFRESEEARLVTKVEK